jgi:hypothetical protein
MDYRDSGCAVSLVWLQNMSAYFCAMSIFVGAGNLGVGAFPFCIDM